MDDYWSNNWRPIPPKIIEGSILCESNKDAKQCLHAIKELIENGYQEPLCWFVGMDMGDVFMHFNGEPMKYLNKQFANSFDEASLKEISEYTKRAYNVFMSFIVPYSEHNGEDIDRAWRAIYPEDDNSTVWWQCSIPKGETKRTIDVWFRNAMED